MKIMVCVNLAPLKLKRKWRARTVQIKLHANKLILVHFRFVLIRQSLDNCNEKLEIKKNKGRFEFVCIIEGA